MGKLVVTEFVTLDGVAQAPGAPDEDKESGFEHGGWQGSTLVAGDLADGIAGVEERHDEVHVIGSLDLVQSLLRLGLVDQLNLWIYPLLLGTGKQVFAGGTVPAALRLVDSATYPNGVIHATYETAGTPTYGNLAVTDE